MDWSKIKTIFIITFLILDVYLLFQFLKIRDANKYELITEASFEEKLKADEIKFGDLPKAPIKAQYLSAKPKKFKKSDLKRLEGEAAVLKDETTIQAKLGNPLQLSSKFEPADLAAFLKSDVLYGDQYQFWEKNDTQKTIIYFQQSDSYPLYHNINGMITFHLNNKNQIASYEQTYLEGIKKLSASSKEEVLTPLKAIETLHQKGILKPKSTITKVELGYSTLIQLAASQVLAPTWRFVVDDKESLFVNAFEGQIIQFNSNEKSVVE
ncbi:hypothetical protein BIV60_13360 [Bacillus sp. MUM 116]|uniref:two-component system regulatory protein YycI n=1 Tax=Bacillus sp. MUM 116 TaxID=1678002 RepID=UPI0008F5B8AF|nr:two-component system regulatory protein YycI [Bacillus sp. MUM 116]OIK13826.1 hypothetical protein BIV60_13360 [Bacillus sp. MUM 116]